MPTKEQAIAALKTCQDPELHLDIYTLELVYEVHVSDASVYVKMTLTSPACPYGPALIEEVKTKLAQIEGVKSVFVDLTFTPPWQPSEDLKAMLMAGAF